MEWVPFEDCLDSFTERLGLVGLDGQALATFAVAVALDRVAYQLRALGNGDAATRMGAIEAHGAAVKDAATTIAGAVIDASSAAK